MTVQELTPGFSDPVRDAAVSFRCLLNAMSRPGLVRALPVQPDCPAPFNAGATVIALSLLDADTTVWVADSLASPAVTAHIAFHTGAKPVATVEDAAFVFAPIADLAGLLPQLSIGTPEYPDRAATLIALVDGFGGTEGRTLSGPGIDGMTEMAPIGLDAAGWDVLSMNAGLFPLGVDTFFAGPSSVAALPRSTRISPNAA